MMTLNYRLGTLGGVAISRLRITGLTCLKKKKQKCKSHQNPCPSNNYMRICEDHCYKTITYAY